MCKLVCLVFGHKVFYLGARRITHEGRLVGLFFPAVCIRCGSDILRAVTKAPSPPK